jgi:Uma2 family endonuclease
MGMTALMTEDELPDALPEPFFGLPPGHEWTIEDLALTPDDGRRYEIIDGSLAVAPAPAFGHQVRCHWLQTALAAARPPGHVVLAGANVGLPAPRTRLLVPDVLAVCVTEDLRPDTLVVPAGAVVVVVETVSPSSVTMDRVTKPALYAEAGIPHYWRVERDDASEWGGTVHVHRAEGGVYRRTHVVRPGQSVTLETPWPVTIAPPEKSLPA